MDNVIIYFATITLVVLAFNTALALVWRATRSKVIRFFPLEPLQVGIAFLGIILWVAIPETWAYLNSPNATGLGWYFGIYFSIQTVGSAIICLQVSRPHNKVTKIANLPLGGYVLLKQNENDRISGIRRVVRINYDNTPIEVSDAPWQWLDDDVSFTRFEAADHMIHTVFCRE